MEPQQQGDKASATRGEENPVQEPTNGQADVEAVTREPRWVLLPGQVDPHRDCYKALAWTSGDPHPADDAPDEFGATPMSPAAAEDAKPGDPSPDAFKRYRTRYLEERERQKSKARQ